MVDGNGGANVRGVGRSRPERAGSSRRAFRPGCEGLDARQLLAASLAPVATVTVPTTVGFQIPLQGGTNNQTYTVTSDNPLVKASVAQGNFLTIGVAHTSSGAGDNSFTGSMTFQLFGDLTPVTVSRIEQLVASGFYTSPTDPTASGATPQPAQLSSKNIHRVVPGFVVQGGSLSGDGSGRYTAAGFPYPDEYNPQLVYDGTGQLAIANAGPDTNDTQFFVTLGPQRSLDFNKTIFGQLVSGSETLAAVAGVARSTATGSTENSTPVSPILITAATLSATNPNGVIHVDATTAPAGQAANLTVTATDPTDGTTATQVVPVTVAPNNNTNGTAITQRPFLGPLPATQTVGTINGTPQVDVFRVPVVSTTPGTTNTIVVGSGTTTSSSGETVINTTIPNATATVDQATGIVRVTPTAGFTGTINLLVGVRNDANPAQAQSSTATLANINNFDTQAISLAVTSSGAVNLAPIAAPVAAPATVNTPLPVQLVGDTANPQSSQTLTYQVVSGPTSGTISDFNAQAGTFTYTSNPNFLGTDAITYRVTDAGDPTPSLTSDVATATITVTGGNTGAVRVIGRTLVVTAPARGRRASNAIGINQVSGNLQVLVNGVIDATQPAVSGIDRIVVYGSKASDAILVAPNVTPPATLNGGRGGRNVLQAGNASSRLHGWFGQTRLTGGTANDALVGRSGGVTFGQSGGRDTLFAGSVTPAATVHKKEPAPTGTNFAFNARNRLRTAAAPAISYTNQIQGPRNNFTDDRYAANVPYKN